MLWSPSGPKLVVGTCPLHEYVPMMVATAVHTVTDVGDASLVMYATVTVSPPRNRAPEAVNAVPVGPLVGLTAMVDGRTARVCEPPAEMFTAVVPMSASGVLCWVVVPSP